MFSVKFDPMGGEEGCLMVAIFLFAVVDERDLSVVVAVFVVGAKEEEEEEEAPPDIL